jgi:hypothetical protein
MKSLNIMLLLSVLGRNACTSCGLVSHAVRTSAADADAAHIIVQQGW